MEERGGMEGWTPRELSPGRLEATEPPPVSFPWEKQPSHSDEHTHTHTMVDVRQTWDCAKRRARALAGGSILCCP